MSRQPILSKINRLKQELDIIAKSHAEEYRDRESPLLTATQTLINIEASLKPRRVGIAGVVSEGKSTFINNILGAPILPSGCGSTTSFLIEISSKLGEDFCFEVHYKTKAQFEKYLEYLAVGYGHPEDDLYIETVIYLNNFFDFGSPVVPPSPSAASPALTALGPVLGDEGHSLLDFIGAAAHTESFNSSEELAHVLNALLQSPKIHVVDHVRISGPFDSLPSDIILVDTPGLGDETFANSMRTIDYLPRVDEVWFVSSADHSLALAPVREFFTKVSHVAKIPVHLVVSKSGELDNAAQFDGRNRLRADLFKYYAEIILGESRNKFMDTVSQLSVEQREAMMTMVSAIDIDFVERKIGVDRWIKRLRAIGEKQTQATKCAEIEVATVETRLQNLANTCYPERLTAEEINAWDAATIGLIDSTLHGEDFVQGFPERVAREGVWRDLRPNTKKATMDPCRKGVFRSKSMCRKNIDVNLDIAVEWTNRTTRVRDHLQQRLQEQLKLVPDPNNDQRRDLLRVLQELMNVCFPRDLVSQVQIYLVGRNTYKWNRATMPSEEEFILIPLWLQNHLRQGLLNLRAHVKMTATFLFRHYVDEAVIDPDNHASIQNEVRTALLRISSPSAPEPGGPTVMAEPDVAEWWNVMWARICASLMMVMEQQGL